MKHWIEPQPVAVPDDLIAAVGGHPIVAATLARRGMVEAEAAQRFLNPAHYNPASPNDLPDMDTAVERIQKAIRDKQNILIWGDFDVDGQTSTALLVSALRDVGANVAYHIPNRFSEGHGIHLPTLKTLLDGDIEVLLTCDTGISAHDAVAYAQGRGVDVVITDHHALPETLPNAIAAVNPMRLPDGHPLRELPGVGTAYKFIQALYGSQPSEHLLDLVALGIVADVMVQKDDTRYLLQKGLDVLRQNPRPGLKALMARAEIDPAFLTEMDIGFSIAPRLNALGRLADANPAVDLLTATDDDIIAERINELEGLNQRRRFLTRQVYAAAKQQIQDDESLLKYAALVVAGEDWHTGVVGIVASRLVEDYNCPVIVLSGNEGLLSGSARSVAGADIVQAIHSQANLLRSYGGHNMAAGLSLDSDNLFAFRRGISQAVREMIGRETVTPELRIDAYVKFLEINLDFAEDISRLAPFGNGNPPLTLATKNVRVKSRRTLGSRGDHVELRLQDEDGNEQRVVWWFGDVEAIPQGVFDIAYTVRANMFGGKREALVEWLDTKQSPEAIALTTKPAYEIVDYRNHVDAAAMLAQVRAQYDDAVVYVEGDSSVLGKDRFSIHETDTVIAWIVPPSVTVWQSIIGLAQPQRLVLFGNYPRFTTPQDLIEHIVGLGKYAHNQREGAISLYDISRLTAQTTQSIRLAIRWINASTPMYFEATSDDDYVVTMRTNTVQVAVEKHSQLLNQLKRRMDETVAYRQYWLTQSYD